MGRREFAKEKYEGNDVIRIDHTYGSPSVYFEYEDEYHLLEELQRYRDLEEAGRLIEQKQGTWEQVDGFSICEWRCSECGDERYFEIGTPLGNEVHYCPNCGAKMVAEFSLKELEGDKE